MILIKELSNISHLFHNCEELKEIFFFDNRIFIDDETSLKSEEYTDNDIYFDFNENINNNSADNLYNNLGTNKIFSKYSNCSLSTTKTNKEENLNKEIIINFVTI